MNIRNVFRFTLTILSLNILCIAEASDKMNTLTAKEEAIVLASARAATGDIKGLRGELEKSKHVSLDEYKEVFVQLYAYCGFPRSLNALGCLMELAKQKNSEVSGAEELDSAESVSKESLSIGTKNQTKLIGQKVEGEIFNFAPAIDEFLKAHLFGDIFSRPKLDWRTREIATVAMLSAMDGVESQLNSHIAIAKHNGVSDEEIAEILKLSKAAAKGMENTSAFAFGNENTAYAKYFTGKSYLSLLADGKNLGVPIANVTFEPGCRNNWHSHTGGQILVAVGGEGYYQERGKAARFLKAGDVVEIPPNVVHWHGASPDSWFAHLAIECNPKTNKNTWLEPVSDEEYKKATDKSGR